MHPASTRNEFLRLRISGLSFARIARQLGVSKPTLIAWSRASRRELDSGQAEAQDQAQDEISTTANQELAEIKRRHHALRQEIFSRALHDIPTSCLETLAGELHNRIEHLEAIQHPHCLQPVAKLPRVGGEGRATAIELNHLPTESPVSSPSPPLEERVGERRPFNAPPANSTAVEGQGEGEPSAKSEVSTFQNHAGSEPNRT